LELGNVLKRAVWLPFILIAGCLGGQSRIRIFGTITNDLHALERALARIRKAHPGARLEVA
jgi:hypothetical protein